MNKKCDFCNENRGYNSIYNKDLYSNEVFTIEICQFCGIGRTIYSPEIDLGAYYPQIYYGQDDKRFFSIFESIIKMTRQKRAKKIIKMFNGKSGTALDIGCGRGHMLKKLKKNNWECYGTEISETLSQSLIRDGLKIFNSIDIKSCDFPSNHFDVVTLFHVFEHLQNPVDTLKEIGRILKPGGLLFIEIPNFSSWQAQIKRGQWQHLDAPRHLFHFTVNGLRLVMKKQKFDLVKEKTFSFEYGIFGMVQSLLNVITVEPSVLHSMLYKNKKGRMKNENRSIPFFDKLLTVLLLVPLLVIGTIFEIVAGIFKSGGVLKIESTKAV